jgi:glucose/arabinose dehydrogenase
MLRLRLRGLTALVVAGVLCAVATGCGTASSGATTSHTATAIGAGLRGASGLTATTYASDLTGAAAFAFDADGRLWVATAGYDEDADDAVYVVPRAGAQPVEVISDVHTPLGLLWHDGVLYVSSHERVDAYEGFDGTNFASSHNIVTLPAGVGENNGLVWSSDGRILLGISAPCDACTPTSEYSAAIVSFLPDGSDVRVEASGIRAPIGLAYRPGTDDLFVTMNQRDDLGGATPGDWLAVVRRGDEWGFPDCYGQSSGPCAKTPDPVAELDEHAAVSGITFLDGDAIVAEWATGKVLRVALRGASTSAYDATVTTYVTGIENPVAVVTGPDGALYAGDWASGTVYRIVS